MPYFTGAINQRLMGDMHNFTGRFEGFGLFDVVPHELYVTVRSPVQNPRTEFRKLLKTLYPHQWEGALSSSRNCVTYKAFKVIAILMYLFCCISQTLEASFFLNTDHLPNPAVRIFSRDWSLC